MIQTIFFGIGLGLTLAITLGPAFFALLQISVTKGFRNAVRFAVGICVSDAFLIAIVFLGVASLMEKPAIANIVGLAGGGMLIGIGIHTFLHRSKGREVKIETEIKNVDEIEKRVEQHSKVSLPTKFYVKGFLLNLANPAVWFFWIASVGLVSSRYVDIEGGARIFYLIIFFACTLGTILVTDVAKAFGARQLRSKINEQIMKKINMVFGLVLIGFGVYLIVKSTSWIFEIIVKYYQLIS